MKYTLTFFAAVIVALILQNQFFQPSNNGETATQESVYERVMRTGTIRCGYYPIAPYLIKNPNTGQLSGLWYDYVEAVGNKLNLKVDWNTELGLGDFIEALDSNKIDAMCVGIWNNPPRARKIEFGTPISYQMVLPIVRKDRLPIYKDLTALKSQVKTVACIDGTLAPIIADEFLPNAKKVCLPELSPYSDMFKNVASQKADVTFSTYELYNSFNKHNDNVLAEIHLEEPLKIFAEGIAIKKGAFEFKSMLDNVTDFLILNGQIESIFDKYNFNYGFYQAPKPSLKENK